MSELDFALQSQGLKVVTAADNDTLGAMARIPEWILKSMRFSAFEGLKEAFACELAKRAEKP